MVGRRGGRGTHTFLSPEVQDGIKKKKKTCYRTMGLASKFIIIFSLPFTSLKFYVNFRAF